ncbi:MAG TPA: Gfo/Idh/MocA family oxidoreductase [Bacillaceae bacterium]
MRVGMIGLDTSHCAIFSRLLNDAGDPWHIKGARMVKAIPFFSPDLPISADRIGHFTQTVSEQHEVELTEDLDEFCRDLDGILLTAVDGSSHLEWVKKLAPYGIPLFVDKPIALNTEDVSEMQSIASMHSLPLMSSSSLRFSDGLTKALEELNEPVESLYVYGPLPMQEGVPGYFWYGVHLFEMVAAVMGTAAADIEISRNGNFESCHFHFTGGRSATVMGDLRPHSRFGLVMQTASDTKSIEIWKEPKPYYASLLEQILVFFKTREPIVSLEETKAIVEWMERANRMRLSDDGADS